VLEAKNPRTARDTRGRLNLHFLPGFGDELVTGLTKSKLEVWLNSLVLKSTEREAVRKSKDTANRVLSMVKAILNHALRDPGNRIMDDHAWRLVKPHKGVAVPRAAHFIAEQARALIAATPDEAFAHLLTAAFLTGARYGELITCSVRDFDPVSKTLSVDGKTGPRTIILQPEAVEFFKMISVNWTADAPLLQRDDGWRWSRSHQQRRMALALVRAGLDKEATFYALRHSYISRAIEGEVPLNVIADNCGTSIRMIETTYAKVLAGKRREFIERGAPTLQDLVRTGLADAVGEFNKAALFRATANGIEHLQNLSDIDFAEPPHLPVYSHRVRRLLSVIERAGALRVKDVKNALGWNFQAANSLMQYLKRKSLIQKSDEAFDAPYVLTPMGSLTLAEMTHRGQMTSGYDKNSVIIAPHVRSQSRGREELARPRKPKKQTVVKPPRLPVQSERVLSVLITISNGGAMRIKDISDALRLPPQSTNALIQYLKRKDLVQKTDDSLGAPYILTSLGRVTLTEMEQRRAA